MINIFSSDMITKIIFCLVAIQSVQSVPFEHILDKDETSDIDISGHKLFSGPCYEQYHFSYLTLWKYEAPFETTFPNFKWSVNPKKVCLRTLSIGFLSDIGEVSNPRLYWLILMKKSQKLKWILRQILQVFQSEFK